MHTVKEILRCLQEMGAHAPPRIISWLNVCACMSKKPGIKMVIAYAGSLLIRCDCTSHPAGPGAERKYPLCVNEDYREPGRGLGCVPALCKEIGHHSLGTTNLFIPFDLPHDLMIPFPFFFFKWYVICKIFYFTWDFIGFLREKFRIKNTNKNAK
jgi:hypothetical protein